MKAFYILAASIFSALGATEHHDHASDDGDSNNNNTCSDGLHIIVARGTNEDPDTAGLMGLVADKVAETVPDTSIAPVDYPALDDFYVSATEGVHIMTGMIGRYAEACPDSKMALMGYTQGAQVVLDVLCGKYLGPVYNVTAPLDPHLVGKISAVVLFSDPSHVANMTWNAGSSKNGGWFPRWNSTSCTRYTRKIRSWCDSGDRYCDNGADPNAHLDYFEKYTKDAAKFVVNHYKEDARGQNKQHNKPISPSPAKRNDGTRMVPHSYSYRKPVLNNTAERQSASSLGFAVFLAGVLGVVS